MSKKSSPFSFSELPFPYENGRVFSNTDINNKKCCLSYIYISISKLENYEMLKEAAKKVFFIYKRN